MNTLEVRGPHPYGKLEVSQIVEWEGEGMSYQAFLGDPPESELHVGLPAGKASRVSPEGMVILCNQVLVVRGPAGVALIDAGSGNDKPRPQQPWWNQQRLPFLETLASLGIQPEDVAFVFFSHFHLDHVGFATSWRNERWQPTFPSARHIANEWEIEYYLSLPSEHSQYHPCIEDSIRPLKDAGLLEGARPGEVIGDFKLHDGAGHTPGHLIFEALGCDRPLWFVGDLLHHPAQFAHPEWPSADFNLDAAAATATRRHYFGLLADAGATFFAHHLGNAVRIERYGEAWRLCAP